MGRMAQHAQAASTPRPSQPPPVTSCTPSPSCSARHRLRTFSSSLTSARPVERTYSRNAARSASLAPTRPSSPYRRPRSPTRCPSSSGPSPRSSSGPVCRATSAPSTAAMSGRREEASRYSLQRSNSSPSRVCVGEGRAGPGRGEGRTRRRKHGVCGRSNEA